MQQLASKYYTGMRFLSFYGMGKNIYNGYTTAGAGSRLQAICMSKGTFFVQLEGEQHLEFSCACQAQRAKSSGFIHEKTMFYGNSIAGQKGGDTGRQRI